MKAYFPYLLSLMLVFLSFPAAAVTRYVDLNSPSPTPSYTSWLTAATNIQDAIDVASVSGALVLVTNGIYQKGGRTVYSLTQPNRVVITKLLTVRSVNGP